MRNLIVLFILIVLFCGCENPVEVTAQPKMDITVKILQPISKGQVNFEITNIGGVHINDWSVWFNVNRDSASYRMDMTGQDLYVDQTILRWFFVSEEGFISVTVDKILLI